MISSLWIKSFRCLNELLLDMGGNRKISVFSSNNNGKTSLLESIYILGHLKSFLTPKLNHIVQFNHDAAYMGIKLMNDANVNSYYLKVDQHGNKYLNLNQAIVKKKNEVISLFRASYISSDSLLFITTTPSFRRSQLNGMIAQLSEQYRFDMARYNQLLNQKNKLLKQHPSYELITPINQQLAGLIQSINQMRVRYLASVEESVVKMLDSIQLVTGCLKLTYLATVSEKLSKDEILNQLHRGINNDIQRKMSMIGPHRDDVDILIDDRPLRYFYSRGIGRIIAFLIQLAQFDLVKNKTQLPSIVLLDEPFSEVHHDIKCKLMDIIPNDCWSVYASTQFSEMNDLKFDQTFGIKQGSLCKI